MNPPWKSFACGLPPACVVIDVANLLFSEAQPKPTDAPAQPDPPRSRAG